MAADFDFTSSLLHLLHRASQIADDLFARHDELGGLTSRQFIVLAAVKGNSGTSQTDITLATGIDRSTLTDLIGRLNAKGLVIRNRSRTDARSYEVRLSPEGERILDLAFPVVRSIDERLLAGASDSQRTAALMLLTSIAETAHPQSS